MTPVPRTLMAAALVAALVAAPCAAWFVAGEHDAERDAARVLEQPLREARDVAQRLALQLGSRLESIRRHEAERPYYQYQAFYHDPEGASLGESVTPSPLSRGPDDPLVMAHFQVSSPNLVTLPTLNEGLATRPEPAATRDRSLAKALEAAAPELARDLAPPTAVEPVAQVAAAGEQIQRLDRSAYLQNAQAGKIFENLKKVQQKGPSAGAPPRQPGPAAQGTVPVAVGTLAWRTIELSSRPVLAALRTVRDPQSSRLQGFIVDSTGTARLLSVAAMPARFVASTSVPANRRDDVASELPGTGWSVIVDGTGALQAARAEAASIRSRFRRTFGAGAAAAALAGFGVVGLVWKSERLARERSRFAASAAHELRTPLAGLRIYGEMLSEELGDPERAKSYARLIAAEAERLGRVVANVLGFTRLERGTLHVAPRPGDVEPLVRQVVERHGPALETAGAQASLTIEEALPRALFDPDALRQVIDNLLDNAERHTRAATDRRIEVGVARAGQKIAITVRDHGPGLSKQARSRPFRPLPHDRENGSSAGLGLGLAMVRSLTLAQKGEVRYEDADGGGASFTVVLTAEDAPTF